MSAARRRKPVSSVYSNAMSDAIVTRYPSAAAALTAAEAHVPGAEGDGYNFNGWYGSHDSLAEAIEAARTGVDVSVTRLPGQLPASVSTARSNTYEVAGGRLDVERYTVGEPDCMVVRRRRPAPLNVRIGVHNGAMATTTADVLAERGRRVLSVLHSLVAMGANVQLDIVSMAYIRYGGISNICNIIRIKEFGQYVDARTIAFWIADVSAHRRVGFKLRSVVAAANGGIVDYMGGSCNPSPEDVKREWDLYLPTKGVWTMDNLPTCEQMLAEALEAAKAARTGALMA